MSRFRVVTGLVVVGSVVGAVWIGVRQFRTVTASALPMAPVRAGEFVAVIPTRGQIQARRSVPIYAPLAQDLQIAWMAPPSEPIAQGEPMLRFDSSSAERDLIERRAAQGQAQAALDQAVADARVAEDQDEADLVDARLEVELTRLATAGSDLVARIEAEQAEIDLRLAEQRLRQHEAEVAQHRVSRESQTAALRRELDRATAWVEIVEARIARMEIRAPLAGYAIYAPNRASLSSALGGSQQPFRVGDQVPGGMPLATIPDLSSLIIDVSVEEIDRGRMRLGDAVIVRVDALPGVTIEATLTTISPLAEITFDSRGRSFHVSADLGLEVDPRVRPGMNGSMDVVVDRIPEAAIIPAQALFTRAGAPTVYVVEADGREPRPVEVQVLARNTDEVAVSGVIEGLRVTLVDPFAIDSGEPAPEGPAAGVGLGRAEGRS